MEWPNMGGSTVVCNSDVWLTLFLMTDHLIHGIRSLGSHLNQKAYAISHTDIDILCKVTQEPRGHPQSPSGIEFIGVTSFFLAAILPIDISEWWDECLAVDNQ